MIKEGKRRTERQKYRSEKTFRKESIRNISDSRAARLKKRFDKNVAKEDRLKNEASKGFDDTRGTKKGSVSKSRGRSVDTTKGAATLTRTRGRKVVKAVDRDKAMKLKKKLSKFAKGGKFLDLTGDGKVTRADILKGRVYLEAEDGFLLGSTEPPTAERSLRAEEERLRLRRSGEKLATRLPRLTSAEKRRAKRSLLQKGSWRSKNADSA